MNLASKLVSVTTATVAAAAFMVTTAGPANAADQQMWSETGKTQVWYDDANNRMVVCDHGANDGIGARGYVESHPQSAQNWRWERTVFNGCQEANGIPDGYSMTITACDWVTINGGREIRNCRWSTFTS